MKKRIYLDCSPNNNTHKVIDQFDLNGEFMAVLAQDYLDVGTFEVYGKTDELGAFRDYQALQSYFPFDISLDKLQDKIDFNKANCVFWVWFGPDLVCWQSKHLFIVDSFYIERFHFETYISNNSL
ncbi:hypothetical protein [Moraxella boevrei]|uniref:hypothetical protein n=1 Tax=Faucicola boevrei TaxID=346665 RepID=UPI003734C152